MNKFTNLHLVTFGDEKFRKSVELLTKEAEESNVFSKIHAYSEKDLNNFILEFANKNKRGFGYWIWKPFIILSPSA